MKEGNRCRCPYFNLVKSQSFASSLDTNNIRRDKENYLTLYILNYALGKTVSVRVFR